jgi:UDP-galactopyranose mutase
MINISEIDCIVIGAGFCGSVIARKLAEYNKKVLLLERRSHIAGNMYDEVDSNGILVQRYGPHIFHTNNKEVFDFIIKYGEWVDYRHRCAVELEGAVTPSPANFKTIDLLYDKNEAEALKASLKKRYDGEKSAVIFDLLDSEDTLIRKYAEKLFELNYRPYTVKQWGLLPEEIDPGILKRVPVRLDYTDGYFDDEYQVLPKNGYTRFFRKLLNHENIKVMLNTDALDVIKVDIKNKQIAFEGKPSAVTVVYSGAIDELLDYRYGHLPYRSLKFDYQTKHVDSFQDVSVVAHPKAEGYTRITEYKKMPVQNVPGVTTVVYEYPLPASGKNEPYYPVLNDNNALLYNKYRSDLDDIPNLFLCGRLADYKYYNMDAAVLRAFDTIEIIKGKIQGVQDEPKPG